MSNLWIGLTSSWSKMLYTDLHARWLLFWRRCSQRANTHFFFFNILQYGSHKISEDASGWYWREEKKWRNRKWRKEKAKVSLAMSVDEKWSGCKINVLKSCGREKKTEEMSVDGKKMRNELFTDHEMWMERSGSLSRLITPSSQLSSIDSLTHPILSMIITQLGPLETVNLIKGHNWVGVFLLIWGRKQI